MSKYELLYFNVEGLAETIRAILDFGEADWSNRYVSNWEQEKPTTPYGKVPVLYERQANGETFALAESIAIQRYLASKFGLYGDDAHSSAVQDSIISQLGEVGQALMNVMRGPEAMREELCERFNTSAKHLLIKHGELLTKNGTGHYVGHQTTWADLVAYFMIKLIRQKGFFNKDLQALAGPFEQLATALEQDPKASRALKLHAARAETEYKK
ncbi:hypothetical protein H4R34_003408 [Dimargaris verticillata]|uniref:Glutathione S-transferase n=1 Tax=Dimargaris verticillata TaxID=2761393 RepID=A0A9W8E930_9FUNG|nr:hypothetical protein H4R34_003408 [Dimargaris verticillata]